MLVKSEESLYSFNAWSGAVSRKNEIIEAGKADEFEELIEELYPDGIDETQLNDILWFEEDWWREALDMDDEDEEEDEDPEDEEDEEEDEEE